MSQLEQRGESYPVYPDFDPNISFRGPKELWAEWTPEAAKTGVAG